MLCNKVLETFNFDKLDPSDSIMNLAHRGNLKASSKNGDFEFITPLTIADVPQKANECADINVLLAAAQRLRGELAAQCIAMGPKSEDAPSANGET